ncbi:SRPBCC domain-containing protein [Paenibacillus sp. sptzw28]|uniref:SRPBCC family protein n=1 Tax=Paenibacillus sp. sptzw28 TaxID=715179 RepID=UPI001C6E0766|nr:SRPBCC domain-containing protein [Paenibacillus sp. sptzw28]QYR19250.1 SRPBCC domain-containing protein [Paenibacillus sp. sptzw28]
MSLTLTLDFQYKTTIEKLWSALTDSSKLAKWVANIQTGEAMENDFKPVVGHRFQFRTQPSEYWNGIIDGEVLIVDAPNRVSYTWTSGAGTHTVTWTLQDLGDGKVNLHLEQTGISNEQALGGAKYGWSKWCSELEKVLA